MTHLSRRVRTSLFYALRTAFRLIPMPQTARDNLRQKFLDKHSHWTPDGPTGKPPAGELTRRPYVRSDERAIGYVPYEKGELPNPLPATLVAFYLPQFHTIPENDEWWGKGFTEWRNVTRALPQFEGHYQPKLPGDLGLYDLRNVEVMHEQARLAREYGISAFCFYFYWFGGKTLLETPLRNWLNDKSIDLKFCLCWANEKWTRTWDGRGDEILIDQLHSPEDDIAFIEHIAEYMRDPRYLRVHGKPLLLIYRPGQMPDMKATALRWRDWCLSNDIGEIKIAYVESFDSSSPAQFGLDASIEFPPNQFEVQSLIGKQQLLNERFSGQILNWGDLALSARARPMRSDRYLGVNPSWDNEARRPGNGRVLQYSSPRLYRDWLAKSISADETTASNPIFINAWNEWAEGAFLEPDVRLGYANLRATRDALVLAEKARLPPRPQPAETTLHAIVHAWYPETLRELLADLAENPATWDLTVTTTHALQGEVLQALKGSGFTFRIIIVDNHGRDMLPFLIAAESLLDSGVEFVLKLHTKRSPHRQDGDAWRRDLVSKLAMRGQVNKAVALLEDHPDLGMIAPAGHVVGLGYYWGANKEGVHFLTRRIGLPDVDEQTQTFVSGSMFWVRLDAIRPILDAHFLPLEFETEQGQVDGTLAHAFERIIQHCVESQGYKTLTLDIDQRAANPSALSDSYPYA